MPKGRARVPRASKKSRKQHEAAASYAASYAAANDEAIEAAFWASMVANASSNMIYSSPEAAKDFAARKKEAIKKAEAKAALEGDGGEKKKAKTYVMPRTRYCPIKGHPVLVDEDGNELGPDEIHKAAHQTLSEEDFEVEYQKAREFCLSEGFDPEDYTDFDEEEIEEYNRTHEVGTTATAVSEQPVPVKSESAYAVKTSGVPEDIFAVDPLSAALAAAVEQTLEAKAQAALKMPSPKKKKKKKAKAKAGSDSRPTLISTIAPGLVPTLKTVSPLEPTLSLESPSPSKPTPTLETTSPVMPTITLTAPTPPRPQPAPESTATLTTTSAKDRELLAPSRPRSLPSSPSDKRQAMSELNIDSTRLTPAHEITSFPEIVPKSPRTTRGEAEEGWRPDSDMVIKMAVAAMEADKDRTDFIPDTPIPTTSPHADAPWMPSRTSLLRAAQTEALLTSLVTPRISSYHISDETGVVSTVGREDVLDDDPAPTPTYTQPEVDLLDRMMEKTMRVRREGYEGYMRCLRLNGNRGVRGFREFQGGMGRRVEW